MEEHIEKKLIQQAQKGSHQAFEKLIVEHEQRIYAICLRMLGNEQEAYDAAQEVCLKVWRQLPQFESHSKLSTWLYRITTNQCLDHLRKQKRKQEVSFYKYIGEEEREATYEETTENPIGTYIEEVALQDVIAQALSQLKSEYRILIVLRDMQGYSYEQISNHLDLPVGTVKSRISRARQKLKKILMQNKEPYSSFFRQIGKREDGL